MCVVASRGCVEGEGVREEGGDGDGEREGGGEGGEEQREGGGGGEGCGQKGVWCCVCGESVRG